MYFLRSGDMTNAKQYDLLSHNSLAFEDIMSAVYNGYINYHEVIERLFTLDVDLKEQFDYIACFLTLGDSVPDQIDVYKATAYFFCLVVNFVSYEKKLDKHVPSPYLAVKTAQAWNWDYAEYLNADETLEDQLSDESFTVPITFKYILNELTFTIPLVKIKKGFLRKKDIGYILDTNLNTFGVFTIGNNPEKYKIPKGYLMDLMNDQIIANSSYIFKTPGDLLLAIDKRGSASTMLDVLYINNFFSVATFINDGGNLWVDKDDDLLYVENRQAPNYDGDPDYNTTAVWEKVKEHLFRAITLNRKLYISYKQGNNIALMSS